MKMIRQQDRGNDFKGPLTPNLINCQMQTAASKLIRQKAAALIRHNSEKVGSTRNIVTTIIRHGDNIVGWVELYETHHS
jgi:hypothetical protein